MTRWTRMSASVMIIALTCLAAGCDEPAASPVAIAEPELDMPRCPAGHGLDPMWNIGNPPAAAERVDEYAAALREGDFSRDGTLRGMFPWPYHLWALVDVGYEACPALVDLLSDDTPTPYQYVDEQFRFYPCGYGLDLSRIERIERVATVGDLADYALRILYDIRDMGYRSYGPPEERQAAIERWRDAIATPPTPLGPSGHWHCTPRPSEPLDENSTAARERRLLEGIAPDLEAGWNYAVALADGDLHTSGVPRRQTWGGIPYNLWALIQIGPSAGPKLLALLDHDDLTPLYYPGDQLDFRRRGGAVRRCVSGWTQATIGDLAEYALRTIYDIPDVGYRPGQSRQARMDACHAWIQIVNSHEPS
jgi:hypothetical protein